MAVLSLGLPDPSEISHTDVLLFHRSYKYAESAPHPEFDADHSARHFGCCCHWIQRSRILQSHPIQRSGSQEAAFFSLRSSAAAAGSSMPRSLSRNGSADVHRKTAVLLISPMESFRESIFCCLYRRPAQIFLTFHSSFLKSFLSSYFSKLGTLLSGLPFDLLRHAFHDQSRHFLWMLMIVRADHDKICAIDHCPHTA